MTQIHGLAIDLVIVFKVKKIKVYSFVYSMRNCGIKYGVKPLSYMVPPRRIELPTPPLPRVCSTTELRRLN